MFRKNDQHLQQPLLSDLDALPPKWKERLEASWAGTFYREVFVRLDENPFAVLYSAEASRPNIPINVLVGLETLKAGFGWSDEEMYENFCFNLQVRYALGYRQLNEGQFELRTMYNFRRRLTDHQRETGQNLMEQAFHQITDEQMAAFSIETNKLRMDSSQIASNIRHFSRLQLLVEILQRLHRELSEVDQEQYQAEFAPYLLGTSGQYVYHLKPGSYEEHLTQIGQLMARLIGELEPSYGDQPSYQLLVRVFNDQFMVEIPDDDDPDDDGSQLRPRQGDELQADSLQSPDDPQATYRQKGGDSYQGYVANLTETCSPTNPFQLIVEVQTAPNNTDDAALLAASLPDLKQRTDVEELNTDGGYNSPTLVDPLLRKHKVTLVQSAIRGRQPDPTKLNLDDYHWELDEQEEPVALTAPTGQRVEVEAGRKPNRYIARFGSPPETATPSPSAKPPPPPVLYFSRQELDLALRRQRAAQEQASGRNLRAAVEASIAALKRPFSNDKLPVRGQFRVQSMVLGSALMVNLRRIHRHQTDGKEQTTSTPEPRNPGGLSVSQLFCRQFRELISYLSVGLRFSSLQP